ncbi:MAG: aldo/keto reductase [Chloroflexi bacterium]|nr:aldo/keto reductase [Chloroflexota bacterium]
MTGAVPTRTLGRTGVEVSVLGFGALELRGDEPRFGRPLEPGQAERVLNGVLDAGINVIDTAIDYGVAEETIGRHIAHRRDEYFLATKAGCALDPTAHDPTERTIFGVVLQHDYSRANIVAGVEQSLRRLRTDHIDLLQLHFGPTLEELEQTDAVETLEQLRRSGKVRFIGSSSMLPRLDDHIALGVFDVFQIPYSALQPEHDDAITRAAHAGAGTIIRGGVARGEPGAGQGADRVWQLWDAAALDELLDGATRTEFMLRFTISHPHLHTTIVGTLNPAHLAENLAAVARGPLPADVVAETKRRVAAVAAA